MPIDPKAVDVLEEIQEIVDTHLTALKFFPGGPGSVAVTRLVAELVDSADQARQLCRALIEDWDEWPGPSSLRGKFLELFRRDQLYGNPERLREPAIQCQACRDRGYRRGTDGRWQQCECRNAVPAKLLALLNRDTSRPQSTTPSAPSEVPPAQTRLITQADVDAILLARLSGGGESPAPPANPSQTEPK